MRKSVLRLAFWGCLLLVSVWELWLVLDSLYRMLALRLGNDLAGLATPVIAVACSAIVVYGFVRWHKGGDSRE